MVVRSGNKTPDNKTVRSCNNTLDNKTVRSGNIALDNKSVRSGNNTLDNKTVRSGNITQDNKTVRSGNNTLDNKTVRSDNITQDNKTVRSGFNTAEYKTFDLKILAWNVHGLSDKLGYPDFRSKLTSYDIIFLSETWLYEDSDEKMFKIKGYVDKNFARFKTQKNNQKSSGGIILYVREALKKHVSVVKRVCDHFLVIKITDNPTSQYIIFAYIPPYASQSFL